MIELTHMSDIATIWSHEQSNSALFDWGSLTRVQLGISKDKCRMAVSRQCWSDFDHFEWSRCTGLWEMREKSCHLKGTRKSHHKKGSVRVKVSIGFTVSIVIFLWIEWYLRTLRPFHVWLWSRLHFNFPRKIHNICCWVDCKGQRPGSTAKLHLYRRVYF